MGDDEAATVRTLETYKGVMFSLIKQHRGRVVDSPGDNLLAEFGSVVDAVQCAVSVQKELQTRNANLPENRRMDFRIGINLGDVIEEDDRIYGDGVNIAARLEALADPGGICISKTAFDYIENKLPFGYRFIGDQTVKNITKPVGAYKVIMETRLIDEEEQKAKVPFWRRKAVLSFGIILILAIFAFLYWNFYLRGPSVETASVDRMAYPLPDKPSIAVLPFMNMSGDPDQDYIGDGLSENIISALSVSSDLFVIASNSTFTYKGKPVKVQQVAEELGVQYVLEGSIQKSEDQLRVTAQFIDALSGHHLWAKVYDREMKNLFDLQDEITKKIMVSIQVELGELGEDFRLYAKSTDNLEAWKHYIKGNELYSKYNPEDNARAQEHFETALELDPSFVGVLKGLAFTHLLDGSRGWRDSSLTSMSRAFELALKAVELDEQDPGAHSALGVVLLYQREYEKAITEGKLAITLNPNYSGGHVNLGIIMLFPGRFDEAISLTKKAYRLNPKLSTYFLWPLATNYIFLRRYEEALEVCEQMEESAEKTITLSWLYQELGREEEARAYMAEGLKMRPDRSLEWVERSFPFKNPAHLQRLLDAFRKAGMPEKPPGAVQERPSIAVLPFKDISPEKDQEYFVDGLSEEILNSLAQIPDLTVIARTSSFSFKGTNKKIQEIASELGVDHILEGSVRKAGNTLRITAQLAKAVDGSQLWSKIYDRKLKDILDILAIQEDIAKAVADELKLTLGIGKSLKQLGGTDNLEAYELYLVGKGLISDFPGLETITEDTHAKISRALESLDAAIALDPEFASAWAVKAIFHWARLILMPANRVDSEMDSVQNAALRAIELEPVLAEGYYSLGLSRFVRGDFIEAELAYRKGMKLASAPMKAFFGLLHPAVHSLAVAYFEKASEFEKANLQIDPLNQGTHGLYIFTLGILGDTQRAEEEYDRGRALFGDDWFWGPLFLTILRLGTKGVVSRDEIVYSDLIFDAAKEHLDSPEEGLAELRLFYSEDSNLSENDITNISLWAAYFGDPEFAMDAMEKGIRINATGVFKIWLPVMREVRQLPQFKEFVRELGLVDYWNRFGWPDLCRPVGDDDFECD